jgi:uncharacterized membrane protein YfcA
MELTSTVLFGGLSLSFVVGFLTGVFGVGGGFLMTPCLIIFLGIPGPTAVGTDLAIILANSSLGLFKRRKSGTLDLKLALTIASGSLVGMVGGFYALQALTEMGPIVVHSHEVSAVEFVLLCSFVVLLTGVAGFLFFDYCRLSGHHRKKEWAYCLKSTCFPSDVSLRWKSQDCR